MTILADSMPYSSTVAGWVLTVLSALILTLVAWISRTLIKQNLLLNKLMWAMFPEKKDSLPDQIEEVRDSLADIRARGSDRLKEIMDGINEQLQATRDDKH